ncbi:9114_t:CDS:2, partial [Dentiscutata heterogama]
MTSNRYEEDDLSDMYQLCEVIRLQETGPKEANKSLRNVFKYGDTHSQLRGLTILKALVDNCGESFQAHLYDSVNHKAGFSRRNSSTRPVPQIPSSTSSKARRESLDKSNNKGPQSPTYSPEK